MKLPKTLERYAHLIDEVEDQRGIQNGWWIYLKPGYQNSCDPGCHQLHEDTLKICASYLRDVIPCDCDDCKYELHRVSVEIR